MEKNDSSEQQFRDRWSGRLKQDAMRVPEGYFDTLEERIMVRTLNERPLSSRGRLFTLPAIRIAAAVAAFILVVWVAWMWIPRVHDGASADVAELEATQIYLQDNLYEFEDDLLAMWLAAQEDITPVFSTGEWEELLELPVSDWEEIYREEAL